MTQNLETGKRNYCNSFIGNCMKKVLNLAYKKSVYETLTQCTN